MNEEHFNAYDSNKDGILDFDELIELFDPEDGNSFEATADHLIYHADQAPIFEIKEEYKKKMRNPLLSALISVGPNFSAQFQALF